MVDQNNRNNLLLLFINLAYSQLSPFSFMAWSWQLTSWSNKKCCNWCLYLFQEKIISFDRKNEYQVDSFSEKHELQVWALREKCPNTEFLLDCIFLHLDWIRRDTPYLSVFSPNAGKCGPEQTPYLNTFHAVELKNAKLNNCGQIG